MVKKRKNKKKHSLKHVKKRVTSFLVTVGLLSTAGIVVYGVWAMRDIYKPIATFAAEEQVDIETEDTQFAFFSINIDSDKFIQNASLIAIDKEEHTIKQLTLPENTSIHLPYGLKDFKLKSLYKMAEMEQPNNPLSLIKQTLTDYFGVSTKNIYVLFNNSELQSFYEWISNPYNMFQLAFNADWTTNNVTGNTSRWEMLQLASTIKNIPDQNKSSISILENDIGTKETTIDNTESIITDQNRLDTYIKRAFENKNIIEEKANIIIANATSTQGLARSAARIITNMGGIVVDLQNSETESQETKIIISDNKWLHSVTLQKIVKSLPHSNITTITNSESKSDITIILGKDYATFITGESK